MVVEVHACIDDRLHSISLLHLLQKGAQAAVEGGKRSPSALLHIDDGDEVGILRPHTAQEIAQLLTNGCCGTEEMIHSHGYSRSPGTTQIALQVAVT